jgi:hypothetical protein
MRVIVFLGPTMPRGEAGDVLRATYLPPASRGDVYAAAQSRPWAIAIIDGFFHRVPSVLHKEILWAMSRGIHVYGASSMGALRAAELSPFGMVGVGRIFEAYREGALTDDDEVAIVHGASDSGYLKGSEAMVNIRATLAQALATGIIDADTHAGMIRVAKDMFYPERTWDRLLRAGEAQGVPAEQSRRLAEWLPAGTVDVKRDDALELLRRIGSDMARSTEPTQVSYRFHSTTVWEQHCNGFDGRALPDTPGADESLGDELLDELRLLGEDYDIERERAQSRVLAAELALRQGDTLDPADAEHQVRAIQRDHGLDDEARLGQWLRRNGLSREGFVGLMQDESEVQRILSRYRGWIPKYLYDSLRLSGRYEALEARARTKQGLLSRWGLSSPTLADAGMSESELWRWFFQDLLEQSVPRDIAAYAATRDYEDVDLLRRAALRELLFRRKTIATLDAPADLVSHG